MVTRKNGTASVRVLNDQKKTLFSYAGIRPGMNPDDILLFTDAVATLRGTANGIVNYAETYELES